MKGGINLGKDQRSGLSGVKQFDGEDLYYGDRVKMQQMQQKVWIQQQIAEKEAKKRQEAEAQKLYEKQILEQNRQWTDAESEFKNRKKAMAQAMMEENLRLANIKKDLEKQRKMEDEMLAEHEIQSTLENKFMTEDPNTQQSMLAQHRVLPYHFKGMNAEQRAKILAEREMQLTDNQLIQETKKQEEQLWASQQNALRDQLVKEHLDCTRKQQAQAQALKSMHAQQKLEKKEKWTDFYDEKTPLPDPKKD